MLKTVSNIILLVSVSVLIMVAPCKVRNSIEDALGVPKTVTLNKSKTALNASTCQYTGESVISKGKHITKVLPQVIKQIPSLAVPVVVSITRSEEETSQPLLSTTPLFILYLSLKLHL